MRLPAAWAALTAALMAAVPVAGVHVPAEDIQWACGFGGSGQRGHPDNCGINPVSDPSYGADWLSGSDRVLGVEVNGDARAYPIRVMDQHEIVNDIIGGVAVAVTYCPLCGSGVTFVRTVSINNEQRVLEFTASGFLYKHDLVMYDPQTHTLWTQILGRPIGTLVEGRVSNTHLEARLEPLPTQVMSWDDWRVLHPASLLLEPPRGAAAYARTAYAGYGDSCRLGISGENNCDIAGLHPKELVLGVAQDGGPTIAYPLFALGNGVLVDPTRDLVVVASGAGYAQAYSAGGRNFTDTGGVWRDETGAVWDLASAASANGTRLDPVEGLVLYWFAWNEHQPDTELWLPAGAVEGAKERDNQTPGLGVGLLVVALAVAAAWQALLRVHGRR